MHPALWLLLWMDMRSGLRSLVRGKRWYRKLGMVVMLLLFIGFIAFGQYANVQMARSRAPGDAQDQIIAAQSLRFGAAMPFWALVYLLATWLTAAADRGLVMRPAEIHFLVSGPFSTRDILTLNLIRLAYRSFFSSIVLSAVAFAYMPNVLAGFVGIWMVLCVSLLVGMIASLAARQALPAAVRTGRTLLSIVALGVLVMMVIQSVRSIEEQGGVLDFSRVAAGASQTQLGQIVLPPIAWMFAPLQQRQFWPTVPLQMLTRLPILALLVAAVYALGGAFGEAATERTDRAVARRQAALRSGTSVQGAWLKRIALPQLGRLGGIGSVAWLELTMALRLLPRFILYTASIVTLILVVPVFINGERMEGYAGLMWMAGLTTYADFLLLLQLPVGFLGPASHRLVFKLLPLPAWRISLGVLAGPLLPIMVTHVLTLGVFVYLLPDRASELGMVSLVLIPVAFVLAATINLLGLWNVIKPRALQQRDALAAGRAMLSVWLFTFMTIPSAALAGVGAFLGGLVSPTLAGYLAGTGLGLSLAGAVLVGLLALFFARWFPEAGAIEEEQELNR